MNGPAPELADDRYRDLLFVGEGGMGSVYRAWDTTLERHVALKFVKADQQGGERALARFVREARSLAKLRHPGLVQVYELCTTTKPPYIVMEYLDGTSLADILTHEGDLSPTEGLSLVRQLADALAYLHEQGIIHRDIKPGNIIRRSDGQWLLTDFGLVRTLDATRLTVDGELVGTLAFYPPELFAGEEFSPASDVYQIGLVLHLACTGTHLHPLPDDPAQWLTEVVRPDWAPLPVDKRLDEPLYDIVSHCCQRTTADRPVDGHALQRLVHGKPHIPPTNGEPHVPRASGEPHVPRTNDQQRQRRRDPRIIALLVIATCVLLAFGTLVRHVSNRPPPINEPTSTENQLYGSPTQPTEVPDSKVRPVDENRGNGTDSMEPSWPYPPGTPFTLRRARERLFEGIRVFGTVNTKDLMVMGVGLGARMRRARDHWLAAYQQSTQTNQSAHLSLLARPLQIASAVYLLVLYDVTTLPVSTIGDFIAGSSVPPAADLQACVTRELPKLMAHFNRSEAPVTIDHIEGLTLVATAFSRTRRWKLDHHVPDEYRRLRTELSAGSPWRSYIDAIRLATKRRFGEASEQATIALNNWPRQTVPQSIAAATPVLLLFAETATRAHLGSVRPKESDLMVLSRALAAFETALTHSFACLATAGSLERDRQWRQFCIIQLTLAAGRSLMTHRERLDDALPALLHICELPLPDWMHDRLNLTRRSLLYAIDDTIGRSQPMVLPLSCTTTELRQRAQRELHSASGQSNSNERRRILRRAHWLHMALCCMDNTRAPDVVGLLDCYEAMAALPRTNHLAVRLLGTNRDFAAAHSQAIINGCPDGKENGRQLRARWQKRYRSGR